MYLEIVSFFFCSLRLLNVSPDHLSLPAVTAPPPPDSGLKRFVKDRQADHKWDDADEAAFITALEGELDKVVKFQESKVHTFFQKNLLDGRRTP